MENKWLLVSSISTLLGIAVGAVYLLFAEHSLLLSNSNWVLSAFWSAFMLWTFVLMFVVALIFNALAFLELDTHKKLLSLIWPKRLLLRVKDKQQQFMQDAELFLQQQGRLSNPSRVGTEYTLLQSAGLEKLVYWQKNQQPADINHIRILFQQMLTADVTCGIAVSYSGFSSQAWIFAREANIELLDAKSLKKQQKRHRSQQFALV